MLVTKKNLDIFSGKGEKIPAIYIPSESGKITVVMAHGLQGSKNEYLDTQARIAEKLQEHGVGTLRIDFCGHGDSERDLKDFTLYSQVEDMVTAIEWLKKENDINSIITLGISFGAPPAIICAELFRDMVKKCVLVAPVTDYNFTFVHPITNWGKEKFGYERLVEGIQVGKLEIDENYFLHKGVLLEMLTANIPSIVKETKFNISIFHGKCDDMVPIETSRNMVSLRNGIQLTELDNTEHGLTEVEDENFISCVTCENLKRVVDEIIS